MEKNEACLGALPGTYILCGEMGYCSNECVIIGSFNCGAAVAFGLMGMAETIKKNWDGNANFIVCQDCKTPRPQTQRWFCRNCVVGSP